MHEVAILETIDHRAKNCVRSPIPTKLRSANVRARIKMKARRLLIDDEDSIEGSVVVSQGRLTSAEIAGTKKERPSEKDLLPSEWRPSTVLEEDPPKKTEEKEANTEVETSNQNRSLRLASLCTRLWKESV